MADTGDSALNSRVEEVTKSAHDVEIVTLEPEEAKSETIEAQESEAVGATPKPIEPKLVK